MPSDPAFAAALDRWGLVPRLVDYQRQRLILGVVGCLAAAGFNLWHPVPELTVEPHTIVLVIGAAYLAGGGALVRIRSVMAGRALARARRNGVGHRDLGLALAETVNRPGNAWLAWAAAGHMAVATAAPLHLHLAGPAGPGLALLLLPTLGQLVHGLATMPSRERLLADLD